jgi:transcription initiation factor TFIIA large subunit
MKQIWTNKLMASKAVEIAPDPQQNNPPPLLGGSSKVNGTKSKKAATNNNEIKSNQNSSVNGNQQPKNLSNPPALLHATTQMKSEPGTQQSVVQQPSQSSQASALQQTAQRIALDPNKLIPIQITLPPQPGTSNSSQRVLTIQVPASAIQENQVGS